ncbi:MAG: hypothetical protein E3J35_10245 [Methanomassiliicoccales archaeon]|nr:MAG: hypothetical protein E3J35_10245 [Methanomassiliicoccales archaeon]
MKRGKASLIVSFFVVAGGFCAILSVLPENARAVTLFVGGGGPGNYTTIQGAVDDANPGDTVFVYNGTYNEFVRIRTPISLVGENKDTTIIGGNYDWGGIEVQTDWVNVTGFTLTKNDDFAPAMSLMNVENCSITNNTISYYLVGISLYQSHNNTIINNSVISNNESGITIHQSNDNVIAGNTISWNFYDGISLIRSYNNTLTGNVMIGNGLYMYGQDVEHWSSHTIDASNTVSGKPVRYLKNAVGGTVPADAGHVILANCTGVVVENQNIDNSTTGMEIAFSSKNYIANNTVASNILWGIWFVQSHENYVFNNTVVLNGDGFELDDSNNNMFVDNNASFNNWDGFYLEIANDNTLTGNTASFNNGTGIASARSVRNKLTENQMVENGVTLSGDSLEYWNTHIIDTSNTVNSKPLYYWKNVTGGTVPSGAGQVILANCSGVVIENQNVSNGNTGITAGFSSNIQIANNTANLSKGSGIHLYRSNRSNIYTNTAYSNSRGVFLYFSENNIVVDNRVSDNSYGVYLSYSDGNAILNNSLNGNSRDGIRLSSWNQNNTITGNFLASNEENGIHFYSTGNSDNLIANNTVRSNKLNGILLNHSKRTIISNNTVIWNHEYGAYLWDCHENVVVNNTFDNNEIGISLSHSALNTIYHNIFGDSTTHAFDSGINFWNTSYPWGGNFWAYYIVADIYSGPDQDQTGSDGIGDVPYDIPGGLNKDWYPLVVPAFPSSPSEPRNLEATPGNGEVTLAWDQPSENGGRSITNYTIYRGDASGEEAFLVQIGKVLTHTDTGLTNGQTYYYEVTATNMLGEGLRSNEANATPENQPPTCNVTDPINGAAISGTITVNGTASDIDGTVEKVEIRIDSTSWIEVTGTTSWSYEWNTTTVSNGDHTVHVRSYDGEDYSIEVSISVVVDNPVPPPPIEPEEDWLWLAVVAAVVSLAIVLSVLYFLLRRRQRPEGVEPPETTEHSSD